MKVMKQKDNKNNSHFPSPRGEGSGVRLYIIPAIERVLLDNEISLALESTPPTYEQILNQKAPDYFNADPFKNQNV